jgi:hypothetical protein
MVTMWMDQITYWGVRGIVLCTVEQAHDLATLGRKLKIALY